MRIRNVPKAENVLKDFSQSCGMKTLLLIYGRQSTLGRTLSRVKPMIFLSLRELLSVFRDIFLSLVFIIVFKVRCKMHVMVAYQAACCYYFLIICYTPKFQLLTTIENQKMKAERCIIQSVYLFLKCFRNVYSFILFYSQNNQFNQDKLFKRFQMLISMELVSVKITVMKYNL